MINTNIIALAAQAWEGFQEIGRGHVLVEPDGANDAWSSFVSYRNIQEEALKELRAAVDLYDPKTEIVVAIANSRLVFVLESPVSPEQSFNELRGRADEFMPELRGGAL